MTWLPRRRDVLAATRLAHLFGYLDGSQVVIVTDRGTELPIPRGCQWTVLELNQMLAEIDGLPELAPGSSRA